ncbi:hypothetical protein FHS19_006894 [Paenibacillus rhizosphaerae]|uniref:Uncharacterized protein n=1 Tax=Paenibacillus rhizosphaerae TaxID=297318 RepID=A0A839U5R4_9BACL|nr:hypothetical protein [Paenibacillus rhizosphaerae]MBB3132167.1 hypothetical protein [Paenibacillus rhizosphaerae]
MSGKVIQNDEQYEKALQALPEMARELLDPLLLPEVREKKQRIYDRTSELIMQYRRGGLVLEYPYLKKAYEEIGYQWQEREPEAAQSVDTEPPGNNDTNDTPEKPEPLKEQPEADTTPASKIMAWLDE